MSEQEERQRVVNIARTWIGTPYHTAGRLKRVGVDCLTLLAEVFHEAELIEKVKIPHYPADWHLHRDAERYLEGLLQYTYELSPVATPQPGDIALWKFGRCFSHGAIVVAWPMVIHAYLNRVVSYENVVQAMWLSNIGENVADRGKPRPVKFFSFSKWK